MSDQRPAAFEIPCLRHNSWFALNAYPARQGIAIYFRDITEQKRALEARRLMEEKLHQSQKMEAVGQFTGGVAHDFNNLLAIVSGNLERIEDVANEKIKYFASAARRATDRGTQLIAQLLAFSRSQRLRPKLVNANCLISDFEGLIRQALGGGYELRLHLQDQLWLCDVDGPQLETALLNLALSGRDAMPDGGALDIETRNIVVDERTPEYVPGAYVEISVTDTGCGMTPEVRDRVFEPFFTTKEVGKGTGLGLSMVYGFVRQSGGHIAIESALGKGTTVTLFLPKALQQPDGKADSSPVQPIPEGSEQILIVDDNEDLLEVTSSMLTKLGYRVSCARSGAEAAKILETEQKFEILFSDVLMPNGLNGIELARRARQVNKDIKVLLTSGATKNALKGHEDEFEILHKPYRLSDLAERLRALLHEPL
jgi:signal transduction histidine kinase